MERESLEKGDTQSSIGEITRNKEDETKIISDLKKRILHHKKSSTLHMIATIFSIFVCLSIFVGADKINNKILDYIFMTDAEIKANEKLKEAEARIYESLAVLGIELAAIIRNLPDDLKPAIQKLIDRINRFDDGKKHSPTNFDFHPNARMISPASSQIKRNLPVENYINVQSYTQNQNEIDKTIAAKKETLAILDTIIGKMKQNTPDVVIETSKIDYDARIRVAEIESESKEKIAELEEAKIHTVESENSSRIEMISNTVTSGITRIGSLFILVWVVRIFNANRQRQNSLAEFYQAVLDYKNFRHADPSLKLADLLPPRPRFREPGDDMLILATEIAKGR
ncbi:hypothetical protein J2847_002466 [Azospirillum agricola]|uniref:hypothetical protein n=1 Tax=Azospirillum agricola TaxID=1720247 RepID=UPI001AE5FA63|nr:hypothetical protein [Azospirillum agricola]MBP2229172.1 hypothetical protein [Azospirillum agricola]